MTNPLRASRLSDAPTACAKALTLHSLREGHERAVALHIEELWLGFGIREGGDVARREVARVI